MGRSGPLCFLFSSLSKFPPIGPANGLQRASSVLPASTHIIGLCLSLSINHGLTGSESPDSAVNHNTYQGGRDLMAWARVAGAGTELKTPGLNVKCSKLTDLFGAGVHTPAGAAAPGDERVEAYAK